MCYYYTVTVLYSCGCGKTGKRQIEICNRPDECGGPENNVSHADSTRLAHPCARHGGSDEV